MTSRYTYPKKYIDKNEVEKIVLVFANGETIVISKSEVKDFCFKLFDNLVYNENGFLPVAQSGFIKLKLSDKKPKYDCSFIFDKKEYNADRKTYVKKRCESGGIVKIVLINEDNWNFDILCGAKGCVDGDNLIINVCSDVNFGSADGENLVVDLPDVSKIDIRKVDVDFENCEYFDVYDDEIVDVNFTYKKELGWDGRNIYREIDGGYFVVKFNKDMSKRETNIWGKGSDEIKVPTIKQLKRRLCKKEKEETDVCALYIEYNDGFYSRREEKFRINEIRDLSQYDCDKCDVCNINCPAEGFVSGYAQRQKDGSIKIVFGKLC